MKKYFYLLFIILFCCYYHQAHANHLLSPGDSTITYVGCLGDGYFININGNDYDEINPSGTETIPNGSYLGTDSVVTIDLVFNPISYGSESWIGCGPDGYAVTVNGVTYDYNNPSGIETLTNYLGCDSIVTINLVYSNGPPLFQNVNYYGCIGDGFTLEVGNSLFDESNPSGQVLFADQSYCDSTVIVNMDFSCSNPVITNPSEVVYSCSGTFTDSGGSSANYSNAENNTTTICADEYQVISLDFIGFDIENNYDSLWIYDGMNEAAPLIGGYSGVISPGAVASSNPCLTVVFYSDGSVFLPGWEANISCYTNPSLSTGFENYTGCTGDGYAATVNGVVYDESNPSGTEVIVNGSYLGIDSTVVINLIYNPESTGEENYEGQAGDGYEAFVNGTIYNEINPTGTEVLTNQFGCDSTVTINLIFYPPTTSFLDYNGCVGDGYAITVNGIVYDESNPTGSETINGGSYLGTDSTIIINLIYNDFDLVINEVGPPIACGNDVSSLEALATNTNDILNYIWSNGSTTSIITAVPSGTYTVTVTDETGCTKVADYILGDFTNTQCVFPGDANYDFVVNSQDHLTVCLAGGETGIPRATQGISWNAHYAENWNVQALAGVDNKHLDCNGDGMINVTDLSAVTANYTFTHDGVNPLRMEGEPSVRLIFPAENNVDTQNPTITGQLVLDNPDTQGNVEDLYGIAFNLLYDPNFVEEGSIVFNYDDNAWLGNSLEVLPLYMDFYDQGQMDIAYTRGDQVSVSGTGVIATIQFDVNANLLATGSELAIPMSIGWVYAHNNLAEEKAFNVESEDVNVSIISSNTPLLSEDLIKVYPNPTNGQIIIDINDLGGKNFVLYNTLGQQIHEGSIQQEITPVNLASYSAGIYFLTVNTEEGQINVKLVLE